jgi:nitrate reductase (NAD(P)H)
MSGRFGPQVSLPVTNISAGNRRKEQNMTKKTIGFKCGCGAVGNTVWTGVRLCDILAVLGITKVSKQHRYIHFEGPEGELPQGPKGVYGTSIDLGWALNRERDTMLAFKQNGELLTPDHGAPLRTLLPGCIGGRMVKFLTKMWVSSEPSASHYHYFDNRVLPPHVDSELATKEGWWFKEEYIINHMNINSAMFEPRHNSYFKLTGPKVANTMKVCGYAYAGGGLKIIRAEISLDSGKTWEMTDLTRPEDAIAEARGTDKHWCWSWWETEVDATKLKDCKEICCRAVDCNQNMQPMFLTWNVMGMMNNCLFRIKVHQLEDGSGVWFEHPTQAGNQPGGWMTEDAGQYDSVTATECAPGAKGRSPNRPVAAAWSYQLEDGSEKVEKKEFKPPARQALASDKAGKLVTSNEDWLRDGITMEEVAKHNHAGSAWIVVKDRVYDATPYLEAHPGGASSIMISAGDEATEDFEAVHSTKAWQTLEDYFIGPLKKTTEVPKAISAADVAIADKPFLNPRQFQKMPLVEKIVVSQDTRIFRFGLPSPSMKLGLPTGMHIFLKGQWKGETVMRPYTPMTDDNTVGHVDFLIKVYFANVHPRFPDGGKFSQFLDSLKIGDTVDAKGPLGEFNYKGDGAFTWHDKPKNCTHISMIAGGTGLTPCWQVANAVLRDPADKTKVSLLYANQTPGDILAREQLDKLAKDHPDRFKLWYTVDRVPEDQAKDWQYNVGFVNEQLIRDHVFEPEDGRITVMCGPPIMLEKACVPNLLAYGYNQSDIYAF